MMIIQEKVFSIDDLHALETLPENQDKRLELIQGVMFELSPSFVPSAIAAEIIYHLKAYLKKHDLGYVTGADGGYIMSNNDRFIPDVGYISKERLPEVPERDVPVPPDFAVEVKSPTDTIIGIQKKALDYLNFGTQLVWVVYPEKQTVEVYSHAGQGNVNVRTLTLQDNLEGENVLPGLSLPVAEIFP